MELTYNELKKRDVINVTDGRCLGRIIDLRLSFPKGVLVGIVVPGRRVKGIVRFFDKSQLYIDQSRIIRIGGDVILVNINCGEVCSPSTRTNAPIKVEQRPQPCSPQNPCNPIKANNEQNQFNIFTSSNLNIDTEDY